MYFTSTLLAELSAFFVFIFVVFIIGYDSCFNTSHLFVVLNQILFFSGVTLTIGFKSTMQFFMKRQNFKVFVVQLFSGSMYAHVFQLSFFTFAFSSIIQGSISFGVGFFFVLIGWPIVGMILEAYGFIVLFRSIQLLL